MTMVALDAPRKKIVPTGSLEARWMVDEGDVAEFIKEAKKQPKMQDLMETEAKQRIEDEQRSSDAAAEERAYRMRLRESLVGPLPASRGKSPA